MIKLLNSTLFECCFLSGVVLFIFGAFMYAAKKEINRLKNERYQPFEDARDPMEGEEWI